MGMKVDRGVRHLAHARQQLCHRLGAQAEQERLIELGKKTKTAHFGLSAIDRSTTMACPSRCENPAWMIPPKTSMSRRVVTMELLNFLASSSSFMNAAASDFACPLRLQLESSARRIPRRELQQFCPRHRDIAAYLADGYLFGGRIPGAFRFAGDLHTACPL